MATKKEGSCPFSPYSGNKDEHGNTVDGFGRLVVGCACGGGIDTYDGDCTCCGSGACDSREYCLKYQRDKLAWRKKMEKKYGH